MKFLNAMILSAVLNTATTSAMQVDCGCDSILKFGRDTKIVARKDLSLLYENQIGIENRLTEAGGSASIITPDGLPLEGAFAALSRKNVFEQYEKLDLRYIDTYVFRNELGPDVADKWLECMKHCNSGAWIEFGSQDEKLLRIGYGDENHYPAKVLSIQTTKNLVLKSDIPSSFNGIKEIAYERKQGTNVAEAVRLLLKLKSGKEVSLFAYLPPRIPKLVHWESEDITTRVPSRRAASWELDIPEIPKGVECVLHCYYQGGSPADQAPVTLTAGVHIHDTMTGKEVGKGLSWKALGPQTHIGPSHQSMSLPAGKYLTKGTLVTERNGGWPGGSLLRMQIVTKLKAEHFELHWDKEQLLDR